MFFRRMAKWAALAGFLLFDFVYSSTQGDHTAMSLRHHFLDACVILLSLLLLFGVICSFPGEASIAAGISGLTSLQNAALDFGL